MGTPNSYHRLRPVAAHHFLSSVSSSSFLTSERISMAEHPPPITRKSPRGRCSLKVNKTKSAPLLLILQINPPHSSGKIFPSIATPGGRVRRTFSRIWSRNGSHFFPSRSCTTQSSEDIEGWIWCSLRPVYTTLVGMYHLLRYWWYLLVP